MAGLEPSLLDLGLCCPPDCCSSVGETDMPFSPSFSILTAALIGNRAADWNRKKEAGKFPEKLPHFQRSLLCFFFEKEWTGIPPSPHFLNGASLFWPCSAALFQYSVKQKWRRHTGANVRMKCPEQGAAVSPRFTCLDQSGIYQLPFLFFSIPK